MLDHDAGSRPVLIPRPTGPETSREWAIRTGAKPKPKPRPKAKPKKGDDRTGAQILVDLARSDYTFGRTPEGDHYAVAKKGANVARVLRGRGGSLRSRLSAQFADQFERPARSGDLTDAITALQGYAERAEPKALAIRTGRHRSNIVIDLGREDGQVVSMLPGAWTIEPRSPLLFRRTALTSEMPVPERGGDIEELRRFVNIKGDDWHLYKAWASFSFVPDVEHPIAWLGGRKDAGKSTAAEFSAQLVDPSPAPLRTPPRDIQEWCVSASASWCVVLDNLSRIHEWLSDALCRVVTGGAMVRRALFEDDGLSILNFHRVVIITTIDAGSMREDLGDRVIPFDLEPIADASRVEKKELRKQFRAAAPALLGALMDVTVRTLAAASDPDAISRMGDFDRYLSAYDAAHGSSARSTYNEGRGRIAEDVVEGSLVALALKKLAATEGATGFVGPAASLLEAITPRNTPLPDDWPANPRALAGAVRRVADSLLAVGVEVIVPTTGNRAKSLDRSRLYTVRMLNP